MKKLKRKGVEKVGESYLILWRAASVRPLP